MVIENTVEKALIHLIRDDETEVYVGESLVSMRIFDQSSKVAFSTRVYRGENYFPKSVRECLSTVFPELPIETFLTVEEDSFSVFLHFIGETELLGHERFQMWLEEFASVADEWRYLLDDHDRRDLIYVRKK